MRKGGKEREKEGRNLMTIPFSMKELVGFFTWVAL